MKRITNLVCDVTDEDEQKYVEARRTTNQSLQSQRHCSMLGVGSAMVPMRKVQEGRGGQDYIRRWGEQQLLLMQFSG